MPRTLAVVVVLIAALGSACEGGDRAGPDHAQPPTERFVAAWSTDTHGDEPLFRPADVAVVGSCELWVPDHGLARVLRWRCDGSEVAPFGRKGDGPGEFRRPSIVVPIGGDSAAVWDGSLERLSIFSAGGRFLGSRAAHLTPGEHGFGRRVAIDGPGLLVAAERFPGLPPGDSALMLVWEVDEAGRPVRAGVREDGPQTLVAWDGMIRASMEAPFARETHVLFLRDGRILVGNTGSARLALLRRRATGEGDDTIDLRISPPAVTATERARWTDSMRAHVRAEIDRVGFPAPQRGVVEKLNEGLVAGAPFPATRNTYLLIVQDDEGHLWVQRDLVLPAGGSRWEVHALDDGRLLRVIDVPTRGRVRAAAVASGALYVVEMDADDQGHVSRYAPAAPR